MNLFFLSIIVSLFSIFFLFFLLGQIRKVYRRFSSDKINFLSANLKEIIFSYLKEQYKTLSEFVLVFFIILLFFLTWREALGFLIGALFSAICGLLIILILFYSQDKILNLSKESRNRALEIGFRGSLAASLFTTSIGVLMLGSYYFLVKSDLRMIVSLSLGVGLIALFLRTGANFYISNLKTFFKNEIREKTEEKKNAKFIFSSELLDVCKIANTIFEKGGLLLEILGFYFMGMSGLAVLENFLQPAKNQLVLLPFLIFNISLLTSILSSFFVKFGINCDFNKNFYKGILGNLFFSAVAFSFIGRRLITSWLVPWGNLYFISLLTLLVIPLVLFVFQYFVQKFFAKLFSKIELRKNIYLIIFSILLILMFLTGYELWGFYKIGIFLVSVLSITAIIANLFAYLFAMDNLNILKTEIFKNKNDSFDQNKRELFRGILIFYLILHFIAANLILFFAYIEETKIFKILNLMHLKFRLISPFFLSLIIVYSFVFLLFKVIRKKRENIKAFFSKLLNLESLSEIDYKNEYKKFLNIVAKNSTRIVFPFCSIIFFLFLIGFLERKEVLGFFLISFSLIVFILFILILVRDRVFVFEKFLKKTSLQEEGFSFVQIEEAKNSVKNLIISTLPLVMGVVNLSALLIALFLV